MDCQDARESFPLLLEGDIALTERVPLEVHLRACADCRQELENLRTKEPARPPAGWRRLPLDLTALRRLPIRWPRFTLDLAPLRRLAIHRPRFSLDLASLRRLSVHRPRFTFDLALPRRLPIRRPRFTFEVAALRRLPGKHPRLTAGFASVRRLLISRVPPGLLAAAVLALLGAALAIFAFERRAELATAFRHVVPTAPAGGDGAPQPAPPSAVSTEPVARPASQPEPPAPALPPAQPVPHASAPAAAPVETVAPQGAQGPPSVAREVRPERTVVRKESRPAQAVRRSGESKSLAGATVGESQGRADVVGRLQVKSRSGAERDLAAIIARAGATTLSRQRGQTSTLVAASVPRAGYSSFATGLRRLGSWQVEAERSPLPDPVRVTVRVID